ncbi:MAG: 30S ribosomal protein S20 [Oscillospiraceae bacterium]
MPNIKSQKKRVLTNAKDTERNKAVKSNLKTVLKKAGAAIATGAENKAEIVSNTSSVIDKALSTGVMHKNAANRKKSHIAKLAN